MLKLNDVFEDPISNGIFNALELFEVPWKSAGLEESLNLSYHWHHSGNKIISPIVERLLVNDKLTSVNIAKLAKAIYTLNGLNWSKEFDTLEFVYNPISNYDMTETEDIYNTNNGVVTDTTTHTGTDSTTHTGTDGRNQTTTSATTNANANNVYGFNSADAVGNNTANGSTDISSTDAETITHNTTDAETLNLADNTNRSTSDSGTSERTLTRSGNIGVTSTQQMIEQERLLWAWYFYDIVFRDIDKMLTLDIY